MEIYPLPVPTLARNFFLAPFLEIILPENDLTLQCQLTNFLLLAKVGTVNCSTRDKTYSVDMPNTVKNSKSYSRLTRTKCFDTTFQRESFYQVFRDFLVRYPRCACVFLSSSTSPKIITFCSQYRKKYSKYCDIQLVSLNIFL